MHCAFEFTTVFNEHVAANKIAKMIVKLITSTAKITGISYLRPSLSYDLCSISHEELENDLSCC